MKLTILSTVSCLILSSVLQANLYFLDAGADTLSRIGFDGLNRVDIVENLTGVPYGLAVDQAAGKLYWTRNGVSTGAQYIQRANLDGSGVETLYTFTGGGEFGAILPTGIILDTANSHLYFTDIANDKLWRADIDGGGAPQLSEMVDFRNFTGSFTGTNEAYGLTAPGPASLTYTISMSGIDGIYDTAAGAIVTPADPGAIVADPITGKYYYTTFSGANTIRSVDFNGANDTELLNGLNFVQGGGSIHVYDGKLYWTEQGSNLGENSVWTADLDGSNPEKLYTNSDGVSGYIYGIVAVPEPASASLFLGLIVLTLTGLSRRR